MRDYSNNVLNAVMETVLRKVSTRQASSFYKVPYRSIMNVKTVLESIQEQRVTPLVENENQQQIYRWVRKNLSLPSGRGHCTDWEIRQSVEEIILLKSSCAAIQENFGVPKTSLQMYLNVLFPSLKCSSLKHLWYLMRLGEIRRKTVRNTITEKIFRFEVGHETHLLKDEEAYIVATIEIEGAYGLQRDTCTISDELQHVLYGVGRRDANNIITPDSALRYDRRVIARVNKEHTFCQKQK